MYKVFTAKVPRVDKGEVFFEPSQTDQLADEPLERIIQRFAAFGNQVRFGESDIDTSQASEEDIDKVFEDGATDDVSRLDAVERAELLQHAERLAELVAKASVSQRKEPEKVSPEVPLEKDEKPQ